MVTALAALAALAPAVPYRSPGKRGRGGGTIYIPGTPLQDDGGYVWVGNTRIRTEKARKLGYTIAAPEGEKPQ